MSFKKMTAALLCSLSMAASAVSCSSGNGSSAPENGSDVPAASKADSNYTISLDSFADTLGAGWNYGNTLEACTAGTPSETVWGNPAASQEMINAVADAGFKTVRIPVSYLSKIDDNNGYKIDEAWLNRVNEVVDYCYNRDLNVIINMHGDGYNSIDGGWFLCNGDNQDYIKEKYAAVWKQIAEKFKDYDEHLIFESMNEEFDGEYHDPVPEYYDNINSYNQIFVDTVRSTGEKNTHRWLLMPGWNTDINYTTGDFGFELPTDEQNTAGEGRIVVSVHCYDPWDYCGDESKGKIFLWGKKGDEIIEINKASKKSKPNWGDETYLAGQVQKLKEKFVDNGIPVIVGEYGCIDKTNGNAGIPNQIAENRAYWDGFFAGTCASMGITPVYWDNGYNGPYGFGLFKRDTAEQSQPEIIETIIRAVNDKDPDAGMSTKITSYTSQKPDEKKEAGAYIGIQTEKYTFRNSCTDGQYGAATEHFNTLIRWEDTDGDGSDDIVDAGAKFEDAVIKESGTYTVAVTGYDFSADSESLNMLFVSTDLTYSPKLSVKDVKLCCDDTEIAVASPVVMEDANGNLYIELVNKYNDALSPIDYTMAKDSFKIEFTIEGVENVIK